MLNLTRALTVIAVACAAASAGAQALPAVPEATVAKIRAAIASRTQGKVPVDAITATPIPGIFQVASDGEIFYTDETARYSFVSATLVDMQAQRDLTAPALEALHQVPFKSLPLHLAVKEVHGNGRRQMVVFEDPNCPICRVFTKFLDQVPDVTIYRFMYPVIAPQSEALARVAWCSADRRQAWVSIMEGARPQGQPQCDVSGLNAILQFGEKHRINNTPTVVLASGKRLVGATPPERFLQELEAGGTVK
jgi:thiol:disulfide interchange protein DsbC